MSRLRSGKEHAKAGNVSPEEIEGLFKNRAIGKLPSPASKVENSRGRRLRIGRQKTKRASPIALDTLGREGYRVAKPSK